LVTSNTSGRNRHVTHSVDAMLNYAYAVLEKAPTMELALLLPQSAGTPTRMLDGLNAIHSLLQDLRVVDVGSSEDYRERGMPPRSATRWRFEPTFPLSVGFAPVYWPPFGRTLAESKDALS
jgi:hypothetical protein